MTRSIVLGLAAALALTVAGCSKKTSPNQSANAMAEDLKAKQPSTPSPIPIPYPNVAASREAGSGLATGRRHFEPTTTPKSVK